MGAVYSNTPSAAPQPSAISKPCIASKAGTAVQRQEVQCLPNTGTSVCPLDIPATRMPPLFENDGSAASYDGNDADADSEDAKAKPGNCPNSEQTAGNRGKVSSTLPHVFDDFCSGASTDDNRNTIQNAADADCEDSKAGSGSRPSSEQTADNVGKASSTLPHAFDDFSSGASNGDNCNTTQNAADADCEDSKPGSGSCPSSEQTADNVGKAFSTLPHVFEDCTSAVSNNENRNSVQNAASAASEDAKAEPESYPSGEQTADAGNAGKVPSVFEDCTRGASNSNNCNTDQNAADADSEDTQAQPGNCASSEQDADASDRGKASSFSSGQAASCCGNSKGPSLKGAAARVRRGVAVRLHSLSGASEMNGSIGLCLYQGEGDRWVVHVDSEPAGSFRNVRQKNLQVIACGGEGKKAAPQKRPREEQENQPLGREAVVRGIVDLECEELRRCCGTERNGLKRRLLLKWHPDKAPSTAHQTLATEVTQAMQCSPQWKY